MNKKHIAHMVATIMVLSAWAESVDSGSISCVADSAESFTVIWEKVNGAEFYIITWYSVTEYHNIVGNNSIDFLHVVLEEYEENLDKYYGIDYASTFVETANAIDMQSYGYIIKSGSDATKEHLISKISPNSTYEVSVRAKDASFNVTLLKCHVTTLQNVYTEISSTQSTGPVAPSTDKSDLDPMILYILIPGTIMSLLSITLLGVLLNRKWRRRIFRSKTPVRAISRESLVSDVTVSIEDCPQRSRPSSAESYSTWLRSNKVESTTEINLKKRKRNRESLYRHYVITPPETFIPSSSPNIKQPSNNDSDTDTDDSYDEDDPFDRLHHRHSLTTVTEESESGDDAKERGERYARFSAKTIDSRLTSRECSFVTYQSITPTSHTGNRRDCQSEKPHHYPSNQWMAIKRENVWTTLSNYQDYGEEHRSHSHSCWYSDDESDYSLRETDEDVTYPTREERYRKRSGRKRPWIERRQRRVKPSVLHVEPLIYPPDEVIRTSEEGARLLGNLAASDMEAKRGVRRNPTPAVGTKRSGLPPVDQKHQFTYRSPHAREKPPATPRPALKATKSSRSIPFM